MNEFGVYPFICLGPEDTEPQDANYCIWSRGEPSQEQIHQHYTM